MFDIKLYSMRAPHEKVDKSGNLTAIKTLKGTLRNETSILAPTILVKSEEWSSIDNPSMCNYARIEKFNRWYYVDLKNTVSKRNGIWEIALFVDPLMSWKKDIRESKAIIVKQEDDLNGNTTIKTDMTNKMLVDGTYKAGVDTSTEVLKFENGTDTELKKSGVSGYEYILTVIGTTISPT